MTFLGYLLAEVMKYQCSKVENQVIETWIQNIASTMWHYWDILTSWSNQVSMFQSRHIRYRNIKLMRYSLSEVDILKNRTMSSKHYISISTVGYSLPEIIKYQCSKELLHQQPDITEILTLWSIKYQCSHKIIHEFRILHQQPDITEILTLWSIKYQCSKVDTSDHRNMSSEYCINSVTLLRYSLPEVIKYQCSKVDTSDHGNMSSEYCINSVTLLRYWLPEVIKYQCSKVDTSDHRNMKLMRYSLSEVSSINVPK